MRRFYGQFAVALTAALSVMFLMSLLGLVAWMLWQPSNPVEAVPSGVKWLFIFGLFCLAVATALASYLARRDHARNGSARK